MPARLRELSLARDSMAHRALSLDLEKIPILAAGRRIDEEHDALVHRIMTERGIPISASIDINPTTGEVVVSSPSAGEKPSDPGPSS
jgi:hypothetical protein